MPGKGQKAANAEGSIYWDKKRKRFIGRVSVPGTYGQKRRTVSAKTKAECRQKMRAVEAELRSGIVLREPQLTFGAYLDRWLRDSARDRVRASTYGRYETIIRRHLIPDLGHVKLGDLYPASLAALYAAKRDTGLAPATVRQIHALISSALEEARKWRLIQTNPALDVTPPPNRPLRESRVLTKDEALRLLAAVKRWRPDRYALYLLALTTGIRQGELLALRWEDLDLDKKTLAVSKTLNTTGTKPTYGPPKSGKSRKIRLTKIAAEALREHRKLQLKERMRDPEWQDRNLVFPSVHGKEMSRRHLTAAFGRLLKREDLPQITFHELRHVAATFLNERGTDMRTLQQILGHADVRVTLNTYSHVSEDMEQAAADKMDEIFG